MAATAKYDIHDNVLDPLCECLTGDVAARIAALELANIFKAGLRNWLRRIR